MKRLIEKILFYMGLEVRRIKLRDARPIEYYRFVSKPKLRDEYKHISFSALGLQYLLDNYYFNTVLDIGSGQGQHSAVFLKKDKKVFSIDLGSSIYHQKTTGEINTVFGDFNEYQFEQMFDCIWASHVLEHQTNINIFLRKCFSLLTDGGILAITVPPMKSEIVGGHVTVWNAGLVLYNLVLAGFNCKKAVVIKYGYNITVIVRKEECKLPMLSNDSGDIEKLVAFLPDGFHERINGNLEQINVK